MTVNVVLLDIEGTTTSINFVKDVLFKFVRDTLVDYLEGAFENTDVQSVITSLRNQALDDITNGMDNVPKISDEETSREQVIQSVVNNVLWNMQLDRKMFALKQLQGQMWKTGYESGAIIGHFYDDVKPALMKWTSMGKKVYIYSSGSVEAQKLLITYNVNGDMSYLISGHFDTAIGHKVVAESYCKIAEVIGSSPQEILFLTDNPAEAVAASEAGLQTKLVVRPGNAPLSEEFLKRFDTLTSFDSLDPENI